MISVQRRLKKLLSGTGRTVCTAESCSGGNIAHLITSVPGSSEYFVGSVVSYAVSVKEKLLAVPEDTIRECGVVSSRTAASMAQGARALLGTDYAVSITGFADLSGDEHEPGGTAWIGVSGPSGTKTFRVSGHTRTDSSKSSYRIRNSNIRLFSTLALSKLLEYIESI